MVRSLTPKSRWNGRHCKSMSSGTSLDEADIADGQDFGSRGTVAYIDQFELSGDAMLGVSLGIQVRDESNPEQGIKQPQDKAGLKQ